MPEPVSTHISRNLIAVPVSGVFYVLAEAQSSVSPNIPYRLLEYAVAGSLPEKVQYDVHLSGSYLSAEVKCGEHTSEPDLDATVHVYDFRMTLDEVLGYIEQGDLPEWFAAYDGGMRDYALVANSLEDCSRSEWIKII